jgi:hypothetical protein
MVKRQKNETTYDGGTGAVNAADVEPGHAGTAEKVEQPATDDRSEDAKQNVYDGAFARGADDLARDQAQPQAQQDLHDHGHQPSRLYMTTSLAERTTDCKHSLLRRNGRSETQG